MSMLKSKRDVTIVLEMRQSIVINNYLLKILLLLVGVQQPITPLSA